MQQHLSGLCCVLLGITLPLFGKPARKWIAVCSFSFYIQYVQCENLWNGEDFCIFFFLHPCLHQFPLFFTKTNNLSPRGELIQDSGWVWCQDASRYVEKASLRIGQAEYLLHIGAVHKWRHHFRRVSLQITHVYMCGLNWKPWIFADDIIYEQPLRGALQLEFSETARMLSYPAWPNQPDWIRSNSEHFIFSSKNQLFGFGGWDIRNPPPL